MSSCANNPVTKTVIVRETPPAVLLVEEAIPKFEGKTNGDMALYAQELKEWAARANTDKAKIKEWADGKRSGD